MFVSDRAYLDLTEFMNNNKIGYWANKHPSRNNTKSKGYCVARRVISSTYNQMMQIYLTKELTQLPQFNESA